MFWMLPCEPGEAATLSVAAPAVAEAVAPAVVPASVASTTAPDPPAAGTAPTGASKAWESSSSVMRYGPSPIGRALKSESARSATAVSPSACSGRIGSKACRRNPPRGVVRVKRTTVALMAVALIPCQVAPSGPL